MRVRYRVELTRANHHVPGLVGDYDELRDARRAGKEAKASNPADRVTIQRGTDTPYEDQPEDRRHEYRHHFLSDGSTPEVID